MSNVCDKVVSVLFLRDDREGGSAWRGGSQRSPPRKRQTEDSRQEGEAEEGWEVVGRKR